MTDYKAKYNTKCNVIGIVEHYIGEDSKGDVYVWAGNLEEAEEARQKFENDLTHTEYHGRFSYHIDRFDRDEAE